MTTGITRNRWTNKEINLAKETLKLTYGNQKRAATILSTQLDRSLSSIQVRLCSLAKKHPSLRKKNIERRAMKNNTVSTTVDAKTVVRKVKSIAIEGDKIIITVL
jgi:hypothetical protein